jgi:hypothetical protein
MKEPMVGIHGMGPGDEKDPARLMGMIVALAGEVYVLRAEVERMRLALRDSGALDDAALIAAGESREMNDFLREEEGAFAATVMRPFAHPDDAPDISPYLEER